MNKKSIRASFRNAVFSRAKYQCELCWLVGYDKNDPKAKIKGVELDAHHITPREKMPNGGYVRENGISLCPNCHISAEMFLTGTLTDDIFSPDNLYKVIGSDYDKACSASADAKECK